MSSHRAERGWTEAHGGSGWVEPVKWEEGSQDRGRAKPGIKFLFSRRSRLSLEKEGTANLGYLKVM